MALNDLVIRQSAPRRKRYTLSDGRGLLLEVRPNGQKYWIVRTWKDGRERRRHIGCCPELSLKDAGLQAGETRTRAFDAAEEKAEPDVIFKDAAEEWLIKRMGDKTESCVRTVRFRLKKYILPEPGNMPLRKMMQAWADYLEGLCGGL